MRTKMEMTDDEKCSLLFWYPKIKDHVPTPKTVIVPLPDGNVEAWMDSGIPKAFVERLRKENTFGYPVFMRTDQLAGKHSWVETCYVANAESMGGNCYRLIEENLMADFLGAMNPKAMVLREFLTLNYAFKAFKGMPVAREFRTFVEDGKLVCYHPYWPQESIKFWAGTKESLNWKKRLAKISEAPSHSEIAQIESLVTKVSSLMPPGTYWSVDVCRTNRGWIVTDLAVGGRSFHWVGCPKARTSSVA